MKQARALERQRLWSGGIALVLGATVGCASGPPPELASAPDSELPYWVSESADSSPDRDFPPTATALSDASSTPQTQPRGGSASVRVPEFVAIGQARVSDGNLEAAKAAAEQAAIRNIRAMVAMRLKQAALAHAQSQANVPDADREAAQRELWSWVGFDTLAGTTQPTIESDVTTPHAQDPSVHWVLAQAKLPGALVIETAASGLRDHYRAAHLSIAPPTPRQLLQWLNSSATGQ